MERIKRSCFPIVGYFILVIGLVIFPHYVQAQIEVGIGAGINRNKLMNVNRIDRPFTSYKSKPGYALELIVRYSVHRNWSLGIEPAFINKNFTLMRSDYYKDVFETTYNQYIQLPVIFTGSVNYGHLSVGIGTGAYAAYWTRRTVRGQLPNISDLTLQSGNYAHVFQNMRPYSYQESHKLSPELFRRWELGWLLGMDFHYKANSQLTLFVAPRYYYSLTAQEKSNVMEQEQRYNETFTIFTGILFKGLLIRNKDER